MPTTSDLRRWWSPACTGPWARLDLHGEGRITVRTATIPAWRAFNAVLVRWRYRTRRADTGAYNCRRITGGSGYSLHAYGIAADINWKSNPYGPRLVTDMPAGMIADIEALRTGNGKQLFRWGGRYRGNKDAMHFEVFCSPADLATGIAVGTPPPTPPPTPAPTPTPIPQLPTEDDDMAKLIRSDPAQGGTGAVIAVSGVLRMAVNTTEDFARWKFISGAETNTNPETFDFFLRNTVDAHNINLAAFHAQAASKELAK